MVNSNLIFGGIEGGATHSHIVLLNGNGIKLAEVEGPATNHWLIGLEKCQDNIRDLVEAAKHKALIPKEQPLNGLGLCLSGCEEEESNNELSSGLLKRFPNIAESVFVASDTIGSLSTACKNGGVILISGTGTNSVLVNPDGKSYQSGGWGNMIGDEGSGFWIAARAVKIVFDEEDGLMDTLHPVDTIRKLIFEHFQLKTRHDILKHLYNNFCKARYASLAAKISLSAQQGDMLSRQIIEDAGFALGRFISSLSSKMSPELLSGEQGVQIVCAGSVFKSWEILKPGFLQGIKPHLKKDVPIPRYTLLRLEVSSAVGSVYQAAQKYGYEIPRDYTKNSKPMFTFGDKQYTYTNGSAKETTNNKLSATVNGFMAERLTSHS